MRLIKSLGKDTTIAGLGRISRIPALVDFCKLLNQPNFLINQNKNSIKAMFVNMLLSDHWFKLIRSVINIFDFILVCTESLYPRGIGPMQSNSRMLFFCNHYCLYKSHRLFQKIAVNVCYETGDHKSVLATFSMRTARFCPKCLQS